MEHHVKHGNSSSSVDTEILSRTGYTIFAIIMGVISVTGIILNVLVIVVTLRHRQLRQPLSYALVNLAICDLGCAVFGGLPTTVTSAMGYFSLGRVGCTLEGFAVAFFGESVHKQHKVLDKKMSLTCANFITSSKKFFEYIPCIFLLSLRYSKSLYNSSHFC